MYKKKWLLLFSLTILTLSVGYVYFVPIRMYIATQRLYSFLKKKDDISKSNIHIISSGKDFKSSRGGFFFNLKVDGSSYIYNYNYSFRNSNWLVTYDKKGTNILIENQHIIFDKE